MRSCGGPAKSYRGAPVFGVTEDAAGKRAVSKEVESPARKRISGDASKASLECGCNSMIAYAAKIPEGRTSDPRLPPDRIAIDVGGENIGDAQRVRRPLYNHQTDLSSLVDDIGTK